MTREDIIRWAREAGWNGIYSKPLMKIAMQEKDFLRFASLAYAAGAATERQACELICHEIKMQNKFQNADDQYDDWNHGIAHGAELCRNAIRARGKQ
ncbi:MAG: hypothetical protein RL156_1745 [Bacteroidota bacterium]|jgi:hypothetical protein